MNPQRSTTVAAACYPAVVIAAWAVVSLGGMGSPHINTSAAAQVVERLAPALAASVELAAVPQAAAMGYAAVGNTDEATAAEFVTQSLIGTQPLPGTTSAPEEPRPVA